MTSPPCGAASLPPPFPATEVDPRTAAPPYRLLTPRSAALRVRAGLEAALGRLPCDHGVLPHFVDSATGAAFGSDPFSTVETSWLAAGALWAAAFLRDPELEALAARL